ncbi:MAG TPA: ABC transporter permease [Gemmatimonadaceae bacterium]
MPNASGTRWVQVIKLRARSMFRRAAVERDLARELQSHIDLQVEDYVTRGMSPDQARQTALREFGGITRFQDDVRDTWHASLVGDLRRDLRYAWRGLSRRPLLLVVSILSIGLGVAVNTTVFALAKTLFLAPPSARDAGRLVNIRTARSSHVSYEQWRALSASGALAGVAGYQIESEVNWLRGDAAVTLVPMLVTANFFDVLGVPIARGRAFTAVEARAELDPRVVVVSDGFWRSALGADSGVIGRAITLNGRPYTVIGVLAPHIRGIFGYGSAPEVYLPLSKTLLPYLGEPGTPVVQLVGRLRDDQTVAEGRAAFTAAARRAEGMMASPADTGFARLEVFAPARGLSQAGPPGSIAAFLAVLLVIVGLILCIACANVAGLLLARNAERRREIALRLALGAGRARLVRQLLTEGLWLALIGTAGGVAIAAPLLALLNGVSLPFPMPIDPGLSLDAGVVGYAVLLIAVACVLSALVPALQATHIALAPTLKDDGRTAFGPRMTLRRMLAIGQVALSLTLLITATLFVRNLARTQSLDTGFDTAHTAVAQIAFVQDRYSREARDAMVETALERVRAIPGVVSAAATTGVPLTIRAGRTTGTGIRIDGVKDEVHVEFSGIDVGPDYFATMGMHTVSGREFRRTDNQTAARVAIVNEEFVRRYFGGRDPVGRTMDLPGDSGAVPTEIVGVVSNAKHRTLGEPTRAAVYASLWQRTNDTRIVFIVARTAADPSALLTPMRRVIGQLDVSTAVEVRTMRSALAFAFLPSRVGAIVVGSLGVLGLVLAMIGLFGVISFGASRRMREIAIRMSLGATRGSVIGLVLRDASVVAGIGMALGIAASLAVTRPLAAFLVDGLSVRDPLSYLGTAVMLGVVAIAASWIPAWRAAGIDPVAVLRQE